ncbi:unnamed protein product [Miscanthus lutarioriparius]|uniref:DUF632 domain-containing protein n=1 Tax=Miscanthus lutarioriparius TaxID=422564 RepID=A0A811P7S2_9POAL|nr:unnamed protein product [Miscanthus lutarioriparius]
MTITSRAYFVVAKSDSVTSQRCASRASSSGSTHNNWSCPALAMMCRCGIMMRPPALRRLIATAATSGIERAVPAGGVAPPEVIGRGNVAHQQATTQRNAAAPAAPGAAASADVAGQIKAQFVRAAGAVRELAPVLEVGRRSYHSRSSVYHVSSRMVSAIVLPHPDHGAVEPLDVGEEKVIEGRSLSLTLQKLYIWEKKLYDEVKFKAGLNRDVMGVSCTLIRVTHQHENTFCMKCFGIGEMKRCIVKASFIHCFIPLKLMWRFGNHVVKLLSWKLSTKIRIAVRVIAKVSKKINKIRDDELWPQINALIQGFVRMWQDKLDCYQKQCQVISDAKDLDFVSGGSSRELAIELELELIKWIVHFSCWAEEIANGVPPHSPGRLGTPLVFVICNSWSQAMDRISEKEVVNSVQALVSTVRKLLEQHVAEQTEQIIAIREREKWNKILERKTLEINKEADVLNRKLALVPGRQSLLPSTHTYQVHNLEASSLQLSMRRVVYALESFASNSLKAFEETLRHAEEERASRENAKAS